LTVRKKLDDAGIGAIVMYSLFEEQIIQESLELTITSLAAHTLSRSDVVFT
jgi:hypothetical protein